MSEWVDVVVCTALIVAVWGWFPAWSSRLTILVIADRNPDWLVDHPEIERRLTESRWFRWSCVLWGSVSFLTLLAFQLDVWPPQLAFLRVTPKWEGLKDLNSALLIVGLVYVSVCTVLFFRWLHANVPISSSRQATLERRSLHDSVPRTFPYAVYAVIVLHLAMWTAVGVTGRYATPAFWGGIAFQFAISGAFLLFMMSAVRRKPGTMDRIFGTHYRRTEVRIAFAVQLLPLLNGGARLHEQVAGDSLGHVDRFLHLGVVLVVVALVMALAVWFRQSGEPASARWPRSATSAGVLAFAAFMSMTQLSGQELSPSAPSDDEIRTQFEYSNLGAGLLGHVLARRAGTDYETLVRSRITGPLGMLRTEIALSPDLRARLAVAHNRFLEPVPNWDSPTLAGAGALRSTVNDMLTFLAAALDGRSSPLTSAFALMTTARRSTPSSAFDIGLGWGIVKDRGTEILFTNGRSGGYRTWLGHEPRTRRGVVVLTNADGVVGPDDLGRHILNPAFPLLRQPPSAPLLRHETTVDPSIVERYVGRYEFAPNVVLAISRKDARVFAQLSGQPPAEIFASSPRQLFCKVVDAQLSFETSDDGRVLAVVLHQNGVDQRARRID